MTEIEYIPDKSLKGDPRKRYAYRVFKRAFDIVFSLVVILILFIPGLLLAGVIAINTEGSPFYREERVMRNGKHFKIFKFRTMIADAWDVEKYLTSEQLEIWHVEHKLDDDPRITKIGKFLRKTSLDELPQFLNVLAGQMSVIGPRPITEEELQNYSELRGHLLHVKPGITGWWQVQSRNEATFETGERQALELYYVDHCGVVLDTQIFFKTFAAIVNETGK